VASLRQELVDREQRDGDSETGARACKNHPEGVTAYDRAVAIDMAEDLVALAAVVLESVKDAEPESPSMVDTCKRLGDAINSLVPILTP
jgi:hypothetical protein